MDEFFVMRKYRRIGVGSAFATRLFDMFPGRWEVAEVAPNTNGAAFWRAVIGKYTDGHFEERIEDIDDYGYIAHRVLKNATPKDGRLNWPDHEIVGS